MSTIAADYSAQFKVLRHIKVSQASPALVDSLLNEYDLRSKTIDPVFNRPRADVLHPGTGWIDTDVPRDEPISREITELTDKFAVAHSVGGIIKEYPRLVDAERARSNAVPDFSVAFKGIEDPEDTITIEEEVVPEPVGRKR